MAIFLISDTHWHHKHICAYSDRPFTSIEEMNEAMIQNWINKVTKDDLVYHLGDVCFGGKEKTQAILSQLPGRKHLILGNHDRDHKPHWWLNAGFDWVTEHPMMIGFGKDKAHDKQFLILSHEPMFMNQHMPYVNIHGHIHHERLDDKQHINVSVEHTGYSPIGLDEIAFMLQQMHGEE